MDNEKWKITKVWDWLFISHSFVQINSFCGRPDYPTQKNQKKKKTFFCDGHEVLDKSLGFLRVGSTVWWFKPLNRWTHHGWMMNDDTVRSLMNNEWWNKRFCGGFIWYEWNFSVEAYPLGVAAAIFGRMSPVCNRGYCEKGLGSY